MAFFRLRVIAVASAAAVAWQPSGPDPEAAARRSLKVIAVPLRNLAKWSVQPPGGRAITCQ
jgi:hypothetical protein